MAPQKLLSIEDIVHPFYNSQERPMGRHEAAAVFDWMDKQAKLLGLEKTPELWHVEHDLPNAAGGFAKHEGRKIGRVFLTRGMLERVFDSPNLNHHVPAGLKGLLGHEMQHVSEMMSGADGMAMRKFPLFAFPLVAMTGYTLYTKAQDRKIQDSSKSLDEHLNAVTEEQQQKMRESGRGDQVDMLEWSKRMALAGGVGLVGGSMIAARMSLNAEFRALAAEVRAAGGAEPCIEVLHKMEKASAELVGPRLQQWTADLSKRSFMDQMSEFYKLVRHELRASTMHKHPSTAEQINHMRKVAAEELGQGLAH